tara:strand:+ start:2770 stop:3012 length:243 start_codon:yes stop_codon:yes gene_type:complete
MSLTLGEFKKGNSKVKFKYNSVKAESSINKIDFNVTQKRTGKPIVKVGRRYRKGNVDIDAGAKMQGKNNFSIGVQGSYKW